MCILKSVGRDAANEQSDVRIIQVLLNLNLDRLVPLEPLVDDGGIGPNTLAAIGEFQRRVMGTPDPAGTVAPGDGTLLELRAGMPPGLTREKLKGIMLTARDPVVDRYFQPLADQMTANQIDTPLRAAHFLAQVGHESLDLRFSEEIADGSAYEDRADLGNTHPGDGPRFKGRGLIQLTGRANYTAFGRDRGRDFVTPENYLLIATDPHLAVDVAGWFWVKHGLNALADADNVTEITRKINGKLNGLADRTARLARAKFFLLA